MRMDISTLSPDCHHSKNGLCSKCVLNQSFSISTAEERHRRNLSNGSITSNGSTSTITLTSKDPSLEEKADDKMTTFPKLPIKTIPLQSDETGNEEDEYVSFTNMSQFKSVEIQKENNGEVVIGPHPEAELRPLLFRLFESDLFSPSIALQYLYSSHERNIRSYLGSKLSSFPNEQIDFYLPQLINMYITDKDVASSIHGYLVNRCQASVHFSLLCVWLLESFGVDRWRIRDKNLGHGELLRQMILNNFQSPKAVNCLGRDKDILDICKPVVNGSLLSPESLDSGLHLTRSESAAASLKYLNLTPSTLSSRRSLDNGCRCFQNNLKKCECGADRLSAEKEFVSWLIKIGSRLTEEASKGEKTRRLVSELLLLNMQLPARVWIPMSNDHVVLRIPPTNSCVLNSKDKAPYCIYVEVLRCDDVMTVEIPKSVTEAEAELHSRLRSASLVSLNDSSSSAPENLLRPSPTPEREMGEIVEIACHDTEEISETFPDTCLPPDTAWDTMSMESSSSEPVLRNGRLQPAEISRRFKHWVNNKRPSRRRQMRPHPDDPSASTMSEPWEEKRERIRQASPFGRMEGWDLIPVIVKSGDDLAQEMIAYQLLVTLKNIWEEEGVPLYLRPCKILVTSPDSGMIEPIVDACSLHQIKRNQFAVFQEEGRNEVPSLESHFVENYGPKGTGSYLRAQQNFVQSCAAYSLVCYFLQVKDRHNGNILIDADGHLIHIDFGFILSVSPKNLGFETSPFKLTTELVNVMGGADSDLYSYFKTLLLKGLIAARKHQEKVTTIIEIMSKGSQMPCFRGGAPALKAMKDRFHLTYTDQQLWNLVNSMVDQSRDSLTTRLYDNFQYYTNGIL